MATTVAPSLTTCPAHVDPPVEITTIDAVKLVPTDGLGSVLVCRYSGMNTPGATPGTAGRFTGILVLDSRPPGAQIFLDGKMVGTTPMLLQAVRAGEHAVRIERDGFVKGCGRLLPFPQPHP